MEVLGMKGVQNITMILTAILITISCQKAKIQNLQVETIVPETLSLNISEEQIQKNISLTLKDNIFAKQDVREKRILDEMEKKEKFEQDLLFKCSPDGTAVKSYTACFRLYVYAWVDALSFLNSTSSEEEVNKFQYYLEELEDFIMENFDEFHQNFYSQDTLKLVNWLDKKILTELSTQEKTDFLVYLILDNPKRISSTFSNFFKEKDFKSSYQWLLLVNSEKGFKLIRDSLNGNYGKYYIIKVLSERIIFPPQFEKKLWKLLLSDNLELKTLAFERLLDMKKNLDKKSKQKFSDELYREREKIIYNKGNLLNNHPLYLILSWIITADNYANIRDVPDFYFRIVKESDDPEIERIVLNALELPQKEQDKIMFQKKIEELKEKNLVEKENLKLLDF